MQKRGKIPLLVGGSGLYIKALTHGLEETPPPNPALRAELSSLSPEELLRRLDAADPQARNFIDVQNSRRVFRALEIHLLTGRSLAELRQSWHSRETPGFRGLLLIREKEELSQRIASTVDRMFARGVIEEIRRVDNVGPTARMSIGLRDIQALLKGDTSHAECREAIILATRRYAKRQLTWFRNQFSFSHIDLTGLRHNIESLEAALKSLEIAA